MTEPTPPDSGLVKGTLQLHTSKLLVGSVVAAVAATAALIVALVSIVLAPKPPAGPDRLPPPPQLDSLAIVAVLTGLFVVAWLAAVVAFSRDQILRRVRELPHSGDHARDLARRTMDESLAALRQELAEDRRAELAALEDRIASLTSEYGEQRETDGYLSGMRAATSQKPGGAEVHPIRRRQPTL